MKRTVVGGGTQLTTQSMVPIPDMPAEFRARIDADIARWMLVIEADKIKLDQSMIRKSGTRSPAFAKPAAAGEGRSEKIMFNQNARARF